MTSNHHSPSGVPVDSPSSRIDDRLRLVSGIATLAVFAISGLALIGWALEIQLLKSIAPQWTSMKIVTAACFLMCAAALTCLQSRKPARWKSNLARLFGIVTGVIGLLTITDYMFELQASHSWPWMRGPFPDLIFAPSFRMAVITAILFSLYGAVLFLLANSRMRAMGIAHGILVPVAMLTYLVLVGHLFNIPDLYIWVNPGVALNSEIAFIALCVAVLFIRPRTWLMRVFTSQEAGGLMARRLLPGILLIPLLVCWLRLYGERAGAFESEIGVAMVAVTYTVCFLWLIWLSAKSVNHTDRLRREAEETSRVSEEKYRIIVENAAEGIWTVNRDYVTTFVNQALADMLGYKSEEMLGLRPTQLMNTDEISKAESNLEKRKAGIVQQSEFKMRRKDGNPLWVLSHASPIFDKDGKYAGAMSMITDITGRKKMEEELREGEERFRAAFEKGAIAMALTAPGGKLLRVNPAFCRLTGYSEEELLSQGFPNITHPDDLPANLAGMRRVLEGEDVSFRMEKRYLRKDGRSLWVDISTAAVRDTLGRVLYLVTHVQDIHARKTAEEELRLTYEGLEHRIRERTMELAKTAQALQAERKRFSDVLDVLPAYVVLLAPDYHVRFANRYFKERFGESHGQCCFKFLFNRNEPCETCETFTVFKTQKPHHWEWLGPDQRDYDISDFPFIDADGSTLILEMGIDITEHKRAEERLREASLYARNLIEASIDPLVTISAQGQITDVNQATELATGVSRDKLIDSDFSFYFTDPQKADEGYRRVFTEGLVKDYPLTIRHMSGRLIDVLYNAVVYKNAAGEIQGVFAAARDITKRKEAQEKQSITNALLELLVKKSSRKAYLDSTVEIIRHWSGCALVGIRIKDEAGNIPYESQVGFDEDFLTLENDLHLDRDKCICVRTIAAKPWEQERRFMSAGGGFFCNDSLGFLNSLSEAERMQYRAICMQHGFQSLAVVPVQYQGKIFGAIHLADYQKDKVLPAKIEFIETTIAPLIGEAIQYFNAEAELEKYRLHLEELVKQRTAELEKANLELQSAMSQREKITEELSRSNKDLEQFAYVASHDLQEPLRAVAGFVELLKRKLQDRLDDKQKEYMRFIVEGAGRMQALIHGLLEYSRIDTRGKMPEPTDANMALEHVLMNLQAVIKESGASIMAGPLPTIRIDALQFEQLLQNLISNAIKFRRGLAPEVRINAEQESGAWRFAVRDNGIGIDNQYRERIFLIFQRLHTRQNYSGTGIGLAICKKIVERHGGRIWMESKPGEGSTFYFTIPDKGEVYE